jgi:hypothetical protein
LPPRPRGPLDDLPPAPDRPEDEPGQRLADHVDLSRFYRELAEVVLCTGEGDVWQTGGTFLLRLRDERWRAIGGAEPAAAELLLWLHQLPGFDAGALRELATSGPRRVATLGPRRR